MGHAPTGADIVAPCRELAEALGAMGYHAERGAKYGGSSSDLVDAANLRAAAAEERRKEFEEAHRAQIVKLEKELAQARGFAAGMIEAGVPATPADAWRERIAFRAMELYIEKAGLAGLMGTGEYRADLAKAVFDLADGMIKQRDARQVRANDGGAA